MEHGGFPTHVYHAQRLRREDIGWIETGETVAIKEISFQCIRANRNRLSEDFYKEAAALHYISNSLRDRPIEETHVLTADTVMCTNTHLYFVMPYCDGGDLFDRVAYAERTRLTENEARYYFEQILIVSLVQPYFLLPLTIRHVSPHSLMYLSNVSIVRDLRLCSVLGSATKTYLPKI
jgi:serine/threonine protein kinase